MLSPDTSGVEHGVNRIELIFITAQDRPCMDTKYRRSDLNRHSFYRNRILSPACLPISPRRHIGMVGFEPNMTTIKSRVHNHFATFRGEGATFVRTASSLGDTSFLLHLCAHKYGSNSIISIKAVSQIPFNYSVLLTRTVSKVSFAGLS